MTQSVPIEISIEGEFFPIDTDEMERVLRSILDEAQIKSGRLDVNIIGNEEIHSVNTEFLGHDYATDVLAFEMERDEAAGLLEGNVLISAEMAQERAEEFGWSAAEELLLYAVHGTLHLVGYDDHEGGDAAAMRQKENEALAVAGRSRPKTEL